MERTPQEKANLIASIIKEYELRRSRIRHVSDFKEYSQLHEEILVKVYDKYIPELLRLSHGMEIKKAIEKL